MSGGAVPSSSGRDPGFPAFAATTLFLDLETSADGRLRALGAVLGDAELCLPAPGEGGGAPRGGIRDVRAALAELERFASGAAAVAGHNLIAHDVPHLRAAGPVPRVLALPAVDTLVLSPLAFPRRPYHQLVKDYKLVRDERSNPAADARLARRLLGDEWDALRVLAATAPDRLAVLRSCLEGWRAAGAGDGPSASGTAAFAGLAGGRLLPDAEVVAAASRILGGLVCARGFAPAAERVLADAAQRPALAYAVEWTLVADTRSVLPRWVRSAFPAVRDLVRAARDTPCGDASCAWCESVHSPRAALRTYFGFSGFRGPPCGERSLPMQEEVVRLGMAGRPLLAVLPTSFGKSLCYQLPALVRHRRRGALTVVLSPLQALMKDQVDVLGRRVRGEYAAAIHGMLTPPERSDVLARTRDGSLALLYVAPEQLRNASFRSAVRSREIGAWVFDEAHCVSKWGHDFRTDYRYAARFIREFSAAEGVEPAPVACFTATAKRDVKEEILAHFRTELGADLEVVEAPVGRANLAFSVREVTEAEKFQVLDAELRETLGAGPGAAIVYLATRRRTEEAARYLADRGWQGRVEAFHAGVDVPRKREIQDLFQGGDLRVICATNAFGMGIDKPDVRLVVHADVPASLENYLQEAGRAGRDDLPSRCVLLWSPADLDVQFRLLARSELTPRDIRSVLRSIRRARRGGDEVVVTPREVLRAEGTDVSFDADDRDARTKVYTAVAWLERAEFLQRDENHTRVFQGRPRVRNLGEADARMAAMDLSETQRKRWRAILQALLAADERQGLDLDELAEAAGLHEWRDDEEGARPTGRRSPALRLLNTLRDMARQGLVDEGLCLSAFVRIGIADPSTERLGALRGVEEAFLDALAESAPDAGPDGEGLPLDLREANEEVRRRGHPTNPETLRRILHSLAEDGRGLADGRGSLALSHAGGDRFRVRLQRTWDALRSTARLRSDVAARALEAILAKAARDGLARGEVLVAFSLDDVLRHVESFPALQARIHEPVAAAERALLYLHEQKVVTLQKGLAVFRQAMGIRFSPGARGGAYTEGDYADLRFHYRERRHQAHAMGEYARLAAEDPRRAAALVSDYFERPWDEFVRTWFAGKEEEIGRATSREAFRRVVEDLGSAAQQRIVAASPRTNLLVLAGPGSGKTRVVVHRCAYLLLVEQVPPTSVLVLCFNRAACHELRVRLRALAGPAALGVQVHTYHGLALRLTGRSLAGPRGDGDAAAPSFDEILRDAVRLLRGEVRVAGFEPDELRDRLLEGYEHVLVDEYQDVDALQYELLSAVAGRAGSAGAREEGATILAVGDDDQNVYGWRGADATYLRRFREDYGAREEYLVENFRSTAHIVAAANALIEPHPGRMKASKPLRVDRGRRGEPRGGRLAKADRVSAGHVEILDVAGRPEQVAAVFGEIERLRLALGGEDFTAFAVLARTHAELEPVRAWCDVRGVPCRRVVRVDALPRIEHVREVAARLDRLRDLGPATLPEAALRERLGIPERAAPGDPWTAILVRAFDEWAEEWRGRPGDALPAADFARHLRESLADERRGHTVGDGVFLGTVHGAKGLEFPHVFVLDGGWGTRAAEPGDARPAGDRAAEQRRAYFVAMTRAKESLHLLRRADAGNPFLAALEADAGTAVRVRAPAVGRGTPPEILGRRVVTLGLADVDLGFAGRRDADSGLHRHVAALRTGQAVHLRAEAGRVVLEDGAGRVVGALSSAAAERWAPHLGDVEEARVFAILRRDRSLAADAFRDSVRSEEWEVPLVEVALRGSA